jgi:predicted dehydrogenase
VPDWLDWSLWQGPAPERPFRDNVVHYNWHWFWHWGTAELGNNGVHTIDVCRWGLGVDFPRQVTCAGGRYRCRDDQETPDTTFCTMDFGDQTITWEARSGWGRTALDPQYDLAFYGDAGILTISGSSYAIYDLKGKQMGKGSSNGGDVTHLQNFLDAIRDGAGLNAEIEEGYKSVLLCHLGNISYRLGRTVRLDPATHGIADDSEAAGRWGREYRPGWEPQV